MNIADLRKSYERAELSEDASRPDPLLPEPGGLRIALASWSPPAGARR